MDRKIIEYLPPIMRDYEEIEQICNAEQHSKEIMWDDTDRMFAERNIDNQTNLGATRWEKTLQIVPKDTESLEVRNFRILGRLHEDLPYTYRTLKKMLESLCGVGNFELNIMYDDYIVKIRVALKSKALKDEVDKLSDRVIPAHMLLDVQLMYNTHRMIANTGLTHAQLSAYTHNQLREEPFEN